MMHAVFDIAAGVVAAYCVLVVGYLLVVTLAALFPRASPEDAHAGAPTCAVLIPAHDEAGQIEQTVARVFQSEYPRERYAVFVIADNCTDNTAQRARDAGAVAVERDEPLARGKGQALDWCLKEHPEIAARHDVVVIIDADSLVAPTFLAHMAAGVSQPGVAAAQSNNLVENPLDTWRTGLTAIGFALVNHVRPEGLQRLRASVGLKGNGMAFRSDVLARYGWPAHSIAEDVEFGMRLTLDGHRTVYACDARITSNMPTARANASAQRRRWELGRLNVARRYIWQLAKGLVLGRDARCLGPLMELMTPPLSMLVLVQMAGLVAGLIAQSGWAYVFALCLTGTALHITLGIRISPLPRKIWLALLAAPVYVAWKLLLYATMLLRRERGWVRTGREGRD